MRLDIENRAGADELLIRRVVDAARVPDAHLLIVAGFEGGVDEYSGLCLPRFLVGLPGPPVFRDHLSQEWDIGIGLSARLCRELPSYPAHFVQILAHELSHASVALLDKDLHVYCSFLDYAIRGASGGKITLWHELPHERAHDAFGVHVAELVMGRPALERDLSAMLASNARSDPRRLRFIQAVQPMNERANLRQDVRMFARPYASRLVVEWDRVLATAAAWGGDSLPAHAPHIAKFLAEDDIVDARSG